MKKLIITIIIVVISFIALTFLSAFFLMNSSKVLSAFNIKESYHIYNTFHIKYDKVSAAVKYKIELMDSNANIIYGFNTTDTDVTFIVNNMVYNMNYSLMVYAYDSVGNYMPARKSYDFTFTDPTFDKSNIILNNEDYTLNINGNINERDYKLNIYSDNNTLVDEILKNNEYKISKDYYLNQEKELEVVLTADGVVVDKVYLYNNMNPIKDIYIETPTSNTSIIYNDVSLIFTGGENADHFNINIYKGKTLVRSSETKKKKIILSQDIFETNNTYRIEVVGIYKEYMKVSDVTFDMTGRDKLKPVYINVNPKAVKKGTKIVLKQPNDANIYYTLNGDDPDTNGMLYTEPIEIDESCTLKTIAKSTLKDNSIVTTYNLNVMNQTNYKFYISPSNQGGNPGVHEVGFTTEKEEMNHIADYLIEKLKEHSNVMVYRNNPAGNINQWNKDANYLGVDFKFAIHSNASVNHTSYGIETWVDSEESATYSLASLLQDKMVEMYPYKDREGFNRGVKYAHGEIGEANDLYVRFGLLIEVAHHDDLQDAKWIKENEKEIGYAMAEVILNYFQVG